MLRCVKYVKSSAWSKLAQKRVGRGIGSGLGKTGGRGHKGLKARTGGSLSLVLKVVKCLYKSVCLNSVLLAVFARYC